jgi:hypothetical protein
VTAWLGELAASLAAWPPFASVASLALSFVGLFYGLVLAWLWLRRQERKRPPRS